MTLGAIKKQKADAFASKVTELVASMKYQGKIPAELLPWINGLSDKHKVQLSELGLIGEVIIDMTVQDLIDRFLPDYEEREGIAASSVTQFTSVLKNRFPAWFKKMKIEDIEPKRQSHKANAEPVFSAATKKLMKRVEMWQRERYAKSSWSRANGRMRELGNWAEKSGFVDYNPFTLLPSPGETNPDGNVYVDREVVEDVVDFCLDQDTRLVLILGRYLGLRLPSEIRTIKWRDINFNEGTIRILDSKSKEYRYPPLFKRVRQELENMTPGKRWLMSPKFLGCSDANNHRKIKQAVLRSPHKPWINIRQNLRTSCENDLLATNPPHLVYQWIGHTERVSRKHYQKPRPQDVQRAIEMDQQIEYGESE